MIESEIRIFQAEDGQTEVQVRFDSETVWLSQKQIGQLFGKDSDTIGLHLKNIYESGELMENSTTEDSSVVQIEGKRKVKRKIRLYNLDAIISVGYRVNSKRGTQFRIWANNILKEYLIKGYSLNERRLAQQNIRLKELQDSLKILSKVLEQRLTSDESIGLLKLVSDYALALDLLDQYDYQRLEIGDISEEETYRLSYEEAIDKINLIKHTYGNSELFGHEKDNSFRSSIAAIYQTFDGYDLYPSIEEKAANLLYFITKNHSFTDGNKRIAAVLFLYFLEKNKILFDIERRKRIADNTLVAITLMIAVSKPEEKETMIKVIVNLINRNN